MRLFLSLLSCGLMFAAQARGQSVSLELLQDQEYYLPNETLIVKVRLTNYSGQTLELGKESDWLTFLVEGLNNTIIPKLAPVPVQGKYTLESSKTGTKPVDLAPYFDLSRPGRYKVTATVRIPQWEAAIQSGPLTFDVISGTKLWEQEFGVPQGADAKGGPPVVRKYAIIQTLHQKQLKLYVRLSDVAETKTFKVFPIGPIVSFSRPDPQIDQFSNLHLLYQVGARSFIYAVVNPDGLIIARETYDIAKSRHPTLRAGQDGRIKVVGGSRRFTDEDLPPSLSSTAQSDAKQPTP